MQEPPPPAYSPPPGEEPPPPAYTPPPDEDPGPPPPPPHADLQPGSLGGIAEESTDDDEPPPPPPVEDASTSEARRARIREINAELERMRLQKLRLEYGMDELACELAELEAAEG